MSLNKVVTTTSKEVIPPFGSVIIKAKTQLMLMGYKMHVMTHGLEKRPSELPLGIEVQNTYTTLKDGSKYIAVILRNVTNEWVKVKWGIPVARVVAANAIPPAEFVAKKDVSEEKSTLSKAE